MLRRAILSIPRYSTLTTQRIRMASYRPNIQDGRTIDEKWIKTDDYLSDKLVAKDDVLQAALDSHKKNDLPEINVAPVQGKFLNFLVGISSSQRVLEIGTLAGYSTIWLARALPSSGALVTLEFSEKNANVAAENIKRAGLSDIVEIRKGDAKKTLKDLINEKQLFDFVFIDADKTGYPAYFDAVLKLVHKGSIIVADNVIRQGNVSDLQSELSAVKGVQAYLDKVSASDFVDSTALQTVGAKGYDGFAISRVIKEPNPTV